MSLNRAIVETILNLYSERLGLTLYVVNRSGKPVVEPIGIDEMFHELVRRSDAKTEQDFAHYIHDYQFPDRVTAFDFIPGLFSFVRPFSMGNYILFAGTAAEPDVKKKLPEVLRQRYGDGRWETLTAATADWTDDQERRWTSELERAALLLEQSAGGQLPLINSMEGREPDRTAFLQRASGAGSVFDFAGIAEEIDDDLFSITDVQGTAAALAESRFRSGEGFLGRALLGKHESIWEHVQADSRGSLFREKGIDAAYLYCCPITHRDGSPLLFFAGTETSAPSSAAGEQGRLLASMLGTSELLASLKLENEAYRVQLHSLMDLCMTMTYAGDVRKIMYMLVDIGLQLTESTFSYMFVQSPLTGRMQLVSRGRQQPLLEQYAKEAAGRYFHADGYAGTLPSVQLMQDGSAVIECPFLHRGELIGVYGVDGGSLVGEELEKLLAFLQSLSVLGAISLQRAMQRWDDVEEQVITVLESAAAEFDPDARTRSALLTRTADRVLSVMDVPEETVHTVLTVCRLSSYSSLYLSTVLKTRETADAAGEARQLFLYPESWRSASTAAKLIALLFAFAEEEDSTAAKELGIDPELTELFCGIVENHVFQEAEFELDGKQEEAESFSILDADLPLSPREKEVLDQLVKGSTNKEIAGTLFISDHTVKNHITKIFQKLNVADRAQAISKVYQLIYQR
ncbi:LuxR C-terminal-related transcriptional regulator [Bacillus daqingensis]|uniref:LuxR C-terminal-related transcriptional regulator n=1 Tax=Bacillus daqingensis TaxID=872396 RepID=A0ABV9NV41_9BACI